MRLLKSTVSASHDNAEPRPSIHEGDEGRKGITFMVTDGQNKLEVKYLVGMGPFLATRLNTPVFSLRHGQILLLKTKSSHAELQQALCQYVGLC